MSDDGRQATNGASNAPDWTLLGSDLDSDL